jgi:hypothetical protein
MQVRVVSFQKHKRLSVVQLLTAQQNTVDYISGPKAIKEDLIQVKEVSESGSVNNLFVFNLSDKYVFFMDGDILMGAKQNRVLNTSVLLAPNSKITLPVSCVEQGRWSRVSAKFMNSDYITPLKVRAGKSRNVSENVICSKDEKLKFNLTIEQKNHLKDHSDKEIVIGIRPEDIRLENDSKNSFELEILIDVLEPMGNETFIYFEVEQNPFIARVKPLKDLRFGEKIKLYIDPTNIYLFDKKLGKNIFYTT